MENFDEKYFAKILKKAAAFCARKECAPLDIEKKLAEYPKEFVDKIIEKLKAENFLNEERFAAAYATDKFRFNQWGKRKIALMMQKQGISNDEIKNALAKIPKNEYNDMLQKLLTAKMRQIKNKTSMQQRAALMRFGISKGFEPALVQNIAAAILK